MFVTLPFICVPFTLTCPQYFPRAWEIVIYIRFLFISISCVNLSVCRWVFASSSSTSWGVYFKVATFGTYGGISKLNVFSKQIIWIL